MGQGEPQAHRRAVVEDVERVRAEPERFREAVDHGGEAVERVAEVFASGHPRLAEAGQVGRDHAVSFGELGNQVSEHMAG